MDKTALSLTKNHLLSLLEREEIIPFYQPIIDMQEQKLYGFEILMRCTCLDRHKTSAELINAFERHSMMSALSQHLLRQAATDLGELDALIPPGLHLSFNISPSQLQEAGFFFNTVRALSAITFNKYNLVAELTESLPLVKTFNVMNNIRRLQLAGVKIYMDDYGKDYSTLQRLEQFELDGLKIDKSFVDKIPADKSASFYIESIISLAKRRHLEVITEGIETHKQSGELCRLGACIQQGFFFTRALDKKQLSVYLNMLSLKDVVLHGIHH